MARKGKPKTVKCCRHCGKAYDHHNKAFCSPGCSDAARLAKAAALCRARNPEWFAEKARRAASKPEPKETGESASWPKETRLMPRSGALEPLAVTLKRVFLPPVREHEVRCGRAMWAAREKTPCAKPTRTG